MADNSVEWRRTNCAYNDTQYNMEVGGTVDAQPNAMSFTAHSNDTGNRERYRASEDCQLVDVCFETPQENSHCLT